MKKLLIKVLSVVVLITSPVFINSDCDKNKKPNETETETAVSTAADSVKVKNDDDNNYPRSQDSGQAIKKKLINQWMFPNDYSQDDILVFDGGNTENFIDIEELIDQFEYINPQITEKQILYIRPRDRRIIGFDKNYPKDIYYRDAKGWEVNSAESMADCLARINLRRDMDMGCYSLEDFINEVLPSKYKNFLKNYRKNELGKKGRKNRE